MEKSMKSSTPTGSSLTMGAIEWAMLIVLSILWGGSFFFVGVAVQELPTLSIVVLRVSLAALFLWSTVAFLGRVVPRKKEVWIAFLGMGFLNNVIPFTLIVWGQQAITSGLASILNATTPLFTVVVAGLLLSDERVSSLKILGIITGFSGVVLMIGTEALVGVGSNIPAQFACLGAAISYAFAGVFGRRFKRLAVDPVVAAAGQVTGSALVLAPIALFVDRPWTLSMPMTSTWMAIVGLALLSTALAYVLYFQILQRAGATNLLLVTFLIPLFAIALGVLFLDEKLGSFELVGMLLIGMGLLAIDGRILKMRRR